MKSVSILLLVLIVVALAVLISFMGNLSTYATVQSSLSQPGTYVHLVARLGRQAPIEYNALKDPNYVSFTVVDTLHRRVKVVYRNAMPENLVTSERLVLKGAVQDGHFECDDIIMKCPSKYKGGSRAASVKLSGSSY